MESLGPTYSGPLPRGGDGHCKSGVVDEECSTWNMPPERKRPLPESRRAVHSGCSVIFVDDLAVRSAIDGRRRAVIVKIKTLQGLLPPHRPHATTGANVYRRRDPDEGSRWPARGMLFHVEQRRLVSTGHVPRGTSRPAFVPSHVPRGTFKSSFVLGHVPRGTSCRTLQKAMFHVEHPH